MPALILILKYYDSYHIQGFNLTVDNVFDAKYLEDINPVILCDILVDNQLTALYGEIERVIWEEDYVRCNYEKDNSFNSAKKSRKIDEKSINPFFDHFRRGRMKDKRLEALHAHLNISREILREIQGMNFTIVTTDDPKRRKLFVDEWKRITLK
ncbi:DNA repair protein Rad50 [Bacillus wiedmannii]|uniref:DNA repair protein Rad50 n=1 Tax=Bacillus wiedmannii TaxID=1890302 RepID=UPI000BFCFAA4|nr:DNA repair protein Rad50 [Bacillus wiedmannii]PHG51390.1 DNA repair protein Rad50 [Bacillus wiedmannii]